MEATKEQPSSLRSFAYLRLKFESIEQETRVIDKCAILSSYFKELLISKDEETLRAALYLCAVRSGLITKFAKLKTKNKTEKWPELEDWFKAPTNDGSLSLTVVEVQKRLKTIENAFFEVDRERLAKELFAEVNKEERDLIFNIITGKVLQQVGQVRTLGALADACSAQNTPNESLEIAKDLKRAQQKCDDFNFLVDTMLNNWSKAANLSIALRSIQETYGKPVALMEISKNIKNVTDWDRWYWTPFREGIRLQVHYKKDEGDLIFLDREGIFENIDENCSREAQSCISNACSNACILEVELINNQELILMDYISTSNTTLQDLRYESRKEYLNKFKESPRVRVAKFEEFEENELINCLRKAKNEGFKGIELRACEATFANVKFAGFEDNAYGIVRLAAEFEELPKEIVSISLHEIDTENRSIVLSRDSSGILRITMPSMRRQKTNEYVTIRQLDSKAIADNYSKNLKSVSHCMSVRRHIELVQNDPGNTELWLNGRESMKICDSPANGSISVFPGSIGFSVVDNEAIVTTNEETWKEIFRTNLPDVREAELEEGSICENECIGELCGFVMRLNEYDTYAQLLKKVSRVQNSMNLLKEAIEERDSSITAQTETVLSHARQLALHYMLDNVLFSISNCMFDIDSVLPELQFTLDQLKEDTQPTIIKLPAVPLQANMNVVRSMILQLGVSRVCASWDDHEMTEMRKKISKKYEIQHRKTEQSIKFIHEGQKSIRIASLELQQLFNQKFRSAVSVASASGMLTAIAQCFKKARAEPEVSTPSIGHLSEQMEGLTIDEKDFMGAFDEIVKGFAELMEENEEILETRPTVLRTEFSLSFLG